MVLSTAQTPAMKETSIAGGMVDKNYLLKDRIDASFPKACKW